MSSPEAPIIPPPRGIPAPKGLVEPEGHHGIHPGDDHSSPSSKKYKPGQMYAIAVVAVLFILGALLAGAFSLRARSIERQEKQRQQEAEQQAPKVQEPGVTSTKPSTKKTLPVPESEVQN